jgi:hypothetical protein
VATYLDSSAIVKLAVREPESLALRRYLRRRPPLVSSALARTEVLRALLPAGTDAGRAAAAPGVPWPALGEFRLTVITQADFTIPWTQIPTTYDSIDTAQIQVR